MPDANSARHNAHGERKAEQEQIVRVVRDAVEGFDETMRADID